MSAASLLSTYCCANPCCRCRRRAGAGRPPGRPAIRRHRQMKFRRWKIRTRAASIVPATKNRLPAMRKRRHALQHEVNGQVGRAPGEINVEEDERHPRRETGRGFGGHGSGGVVMSVLGWRSPSKKPGKENLTPEISGGEWPWSLVKELTPPEIDTSNVPRGMRGGGGRNRLGTDGLVHGRRLHVLATHVKPRCQYSQNCIFIAFSILAAQPASGESTMGARFLPGLVLLLLALPAWAQTDNNTVTGPVSGSSTCWSTRPRRFI